MLPECVNVPFHWEGICRLSACGSQHSCLGFNLFVWMFDVLLGVRGLNSFQNSYPASQNGTPEKNANRFTFGGRKWPFHGRGCLPVLLALKAKREIWASTENFQLLLTQPRWKKKQSAAFFKYSDVLCWCFWQNCSFKRIKLLLKPKLFLATKMATGLHCQLNHKPRW